MARKLTRKEVAAAAGLASEAGVRAAENRGELRSGRDEQGRAVLDEDEVNAWIASRGGRRERAPAQSRPRDPGRLAARVFALFDEGADLRTIVRQVRADPREIRRLFAEWKTSLEAGAKLEAEREHERAEQERARRRHAALRVVMRPVGRPGRP